MVGPELWGQEWFCWRMTLPMGIHQLPSAWYYPHYYLTLSIHYYLTLAWKPLLCSGTASGTRLGPWCEFPEGPFQRASSWEPLSWCSFSHQTKPLCFSCFPRCFRKFLPHQMGRWEKQGKEQNSSLDWIPPMRRPQEPSGLAISPFHCVGFCRGLL